MAAAYMVSALEVGEIEQLSPRDRLVLIGIANHANKNDGTSFPSQARLALATGYDEKTVRGALKSLEARGLLTRAKRGRPGGGRSSDLITLLIPKADLTPGKGGPNGNRGSTKPGEVPEEPDNEPVASRGNVVHSSTTSAGQRNHG